MAMRLAKKTLGDLATRVISPSTRLLNHRFRSSGSSGKKEGIDGRNDDGVSSNLTELIEVEIPEGSDLAGGIRLLQDAVHAIIVRQAAPAWLPLRPGSSYWVPPRRRAAAAAVSTNIVDLFGRIANPLTEEETLSLTSARGWPSSSYYIKGASPHSLEAETELSEESGEEEG